MAFSFGKTKKDPVQRPKPVKSPKIRSKSGNSTAVFWIDESWVKIIFAQGNIPRCRIEFAAALPVNDLSDERIIEDVQKLFADRGVTPERAVVVHPAHLSRARLIRLPSIEPKEIKVMVDLQVEKITPDAKEETLTYYRTVEAGADGYSQVLLVMAHQDRVQRSVRLTQKLTKQLAAVGADLDGLIGWYRRYAEKRSGQPAGGTLLVDIDSHYSSVVIMHGKEAAFHRSIPEKIESVMNGSPPEEADRFLAEIHRSILAYDEEGLKDACTHAVVIGDPVLFSDLAKKMETELKMPVALVPACSGFDINQTAVDQLSGLSRISFASLLGFLFASDAGDLTPAPVKVRRMFEKKVQLFSVLGAQILFSMLLVSGFMLKGVYEDNQYLAALKSKTAQISKPARELEISLEHLKIVKSRLDWHGILLETIVTATAVTPPSIRWENLSYVQSEGVTIKGVSSEMPQVFEMVSELEKSDIFVKPEARRVSKRKVDNKDVTDFEIVLPYAGAAEMVEDEG